MSRNGKKLILFLLLLHRFRSTSHWNWCILVFERFRLCFAFWKQTIHTSNTITIKQLDFSLWLPIILQWYRHRFQNFLSGHHNIIFIVVRRKSPIMNLLGFSTFIIFFVRAFYSKYFNFFLFFAKFRIHRGQNTV